MLREPRTFKTLNTREVPYGSQEVDFGCDQASRRVDKESEGSGDVRFGVHQQSAQGGLDADKAADQLGEDLEEPSPASWPEESQVASAQQQTSWGNPGRLSSIQLEVSYGRFCLVRSDF